MTGLPTTLLGGASATGQVAFAPGAAGAASGNLTIGVTGPDGSSNTVVGLTGNGVTTPPPITDGSGAPYNAVPPTRILDTRTNGGAIGPNSTRSVTVTGVGGVPVGAGAVILNVTATEPTDAGYITVFPAGTVAPTASSLNFVPGQNVANLVTAKVGANGQVSIYNFAGSTQVVFDVVGWFPDTSAAATTLSTEAGSGGQFVPLVPARILDTRAGIGANAAPLGPNSFLDLQVAGVGGLPAADQISAVVMNLTGTNTTAPGFLTAWPTGQQKQVTSNLNFGPGQSVPNLAVIPIGQGGKVSIYNFDGSTDVLGDVVGYFTAPGVSVPGGGLFHAMAPNRFLDTRQSNSAPRRQRGRRAPDHRRAGIPSNAVGVVMNVTATNTS